MGVSCCNPKILWNVSLHVENYLIENDDGRLNLQDYASSSKSSKQKMINGIKNIVNYKPDTTNVCTLRNAGSNEGVGAKGNLLQSKKAPTSFITEPPSLSAGWMRAEENREPRKLERGLESSRGESLERQAASGDAVAAELPSRGASLHSPRWPTETCCARSPQLSCSFEKN